MNMNVFPNIAQLKPRERLLAIGSSVVLLAVLLDRLVRSPWLAHRRTIRAEIRRMEQSLQSRQRLLDRKERVLEELQRYQPYVQPSVADDLRMAALLKEVEGFSQGSRVRVAEIKPLATETNDQESRYSLEVRFACTLEQWVDLLFQIETSPSLYEVVRAGLSVDEESPDRLQGYLRLMSASLHS